ncbi:MAG: hypothetical protein M0019_03370 [Actinomycetota bacterium]|nr:hypothetical protein [Actinomycetota bacterium]
MAISRYAPLRAAIEDRRTIGSNYLLFQIFSEEYLKRIPWVAFSFDTLGEDL